MIEVGMSLRGRSVDKNILLDGNFVEASVVNIRVLATSSSVEWFLSRSFVPVCIKIMWGGVWISFCKNALACSINEVLVYLTWCFEENICFASKNFPFESHRKITSFEGVFWLLVDCFVLFFFDVSCISFSTGFSGDSWRGEKELEVGILTRSSSSSFQWALDRVEAHFLCSSLGAQLAMSSSTWGVVWLEVLTISGGRKSIFSQIAFIWSFRKVTSASQWLCFVFRAALTSDIFVHFFCSAWFSSCSFVIRVACFCNSSLCIWLLLAKSSARPPTVVFWTLKRWSCWTILSFSCSMLPMCVILSRVNSASKFPTVLRKVANELILFGVSESVVIFSAIAG